MTGKKYDFVAECGMASGDELGDVCSKINADYMLLMYTSGMVRCVPAAEITDIPHLLEARLFGRDAELKIMRSTIDREFNWRIIDDKAFRAFCDGSSFDRTYENCVLEEVHFLDIDTTKRSDDPAEYTATGGGRYILPEGGLDRVAIRDYICFDDNGIANIADFVITGFLKEGESHE